MAKAPTSWSFVVPGQPRPWQRAGAFGRKRYTPTPTKAYQRTVATAAMLSRPRGWPLDGRYRVVVDLYHGDCRRRDTDNCAKSVLDALQGRPGRAAVAFEDDDQVDELVVSKSLDRENPRAEVTIEILTEG